MERIRNRTKNRAHSKKLTWQQSSKVLEKIRKQGEYGDFGNREERKIDVSKVDFLVNHCSVIKYIACYIKRVYVNYE